MSGFDPSRCAICGGSSAEVVYEGPVRAGRFGTLTEPVQVLRCVECGTGRLSALLEETCAFYETDKYRTEVDGSCDSAAFHDAHDDEQAERMAIVGPDGLRGAVIADVGCGAGCFLDAVRGAATRLAIEPGEPFHAHLASHGYHVFPYAADALGEWGGRVDLVTCFAVLEHVEDPIALLRDLRALLRPGGRLVLSTPNARDYLLSALPVEYPRFFYRKAHLHYFDAASLLSALESAGFAEAETRFVQRFGLGNAIGWLRDRRPQGDAPFEFVTSAMDEVWRTELERTGSADYLYAVGFAGDRS